MNNLPKKNFRFGVLTGSFDPSSELIQRAKQAEDLGYDVFLLSDHVFNFAPIAGMATVAQATTKLRIGSYVLGNDFWHPAILAREALAIDNLSNGRLEFGIGSGFFAFDYEQTGIPMDPPAVRISRLDESISIIKALLAGNVVTFQGKYYHINQLDLKVKPFQNPHPPIMVGGGSRKVLSLAAQQADIIGINIRTTSNGWFEPSSIKLDATQQKVDWVCQAAGERLRDIELSILMNSVSVTHTFEQTEQASLNLVNNWNSHEVNFTAEDIQNSPHFLVGEVDQIIEKIIQNRERFGISYYVIFDNALEEFAPVVKRLSTS